MREREGEKKKIKIQIERWMDGRKEEGKEEGRKEEEKEGRKERRRKEFLIKNFKFFHKYKTKLKVKQQFEKNISNINKR